jgi:hypothetical protein
MEQAAKRSSAGVRQQQLPQQLRKLQSGIGIAIAHCCQEHPSRAGASIMRAFHGTSAASWPLLLCDAHLMLTNTTFLKVNKTAVAVSPSTTLRAKY